MGKTAVKPSHTNGSTSPQLATDPAPKIVSKADYEKDLELFQASLDFVKSGRR